MGALIWLTQTNVYWLLSVLSQFFFPLTSSLTFVLKKTNFDADLAEQNWL